jgi:hypothetical protein
MATTTMKEVIELIRLHQCKYFSIRRPEKKTILDKRTGVERSIDSYNFVFKSDVNRPLEDNIADFEKTMNLLHSGRFLCVSGDTSSAARGCFEWEFIVNTPGVGNLPDREQQAAQTMPMYPQVAGYIPKEELDSKLDMLEKKLMIDFERKQFEQDKKALDEERREFDRRQSNVFDVAIAKLGDVLDPYLNRKPLAQVAGVDEMSDEQFNAALTSLLERWEAADADWFVLLQKIVALAERKDKNYNLAKSFL